MTEKYDCPSENEADNKSADAEASVRVDENEKRAAFDRKKRIFDIIYLTLTAAFVFVMWCGGFNFMPLFAVALGIGAGLVIAVRILKNKGVGLFIWIAYIVALTGTFVYFLIWGAESFGKNLWWNAVLILAPVALSIAIAMFGKIFDGKKLKAATAVTAFLMAGTALVYVFFMNLRAIPTAERIWEGHDEYLNSLSSSDKKTNSPNVLVILMDDMGYGDLSVYSYLKDKEGKTPTIKTPNIDSIADNGIMMENFYSASPVCSPSRFSMLTGRYPSRGYLDNVVFPTDIQSTPYSITHFVNPFQFLNNVDGILGDEITFAESLQAMGYNTACIGKWNLGDYGEYLPTEQGFDYFYGSYYVNDMTPYTWVRDTGGNHPNGKTHEQVYSHKDKKDQSETTASLTAEVVNFIESSVENDKNFLAYYTSPWPHYPIFSDNNGNGKGDITDDNYIDCIEEFDKGLGEIFDSLKTLKNKNDENVYDNTLIIFSSDNGPGREGVTGALRGRKNTTFDGGMKVPLLAKYVNGGIGQGEGIESTSFDYHYYDGADTAGKPLVGSTKVIDASAMMFDVYPTIMQYVTGGTDKMPKDRIIDGVSMYDLWQAEQPESPIHQKLFYQKQGKCQAIQMRYELDGKTYDFKYYDSVRTENSAFINQVYKNYLFNLDKDAAEGYNISMAHPEIANALKAELNAFRKEMKTNRRGIL